MICLHQAVAVPNARQLSARMASAIEQGMEEDESEDAQVMLDDLQREEFLMAKLSQYTEPVTQDSPDAWPLTCLANLVSQAKGLQVAEDEL